MNTEIPALLAGKGCASCDHPFGALQTFDDWDKNDGQQGVKNMARIALQTKVPQLEQQIANSFSHHVTIQALVRHLLADADQAFYSVSQVISKIYPELITQMYGNGTHTTEEK